MKKYLAYGVVLLGLCCVVAWASGRVSERGFVIIENHSNQTVKNVYVIYDHLSQPKKVWIGSLLPNQRYQHQINFADMNEFRLGIEYDLAGKTQSDTVAGYVADYDKQRYVFEMK